MELLCETTNHSSNQVTSNQEASVERTSNQGTSNQGTSVEGISIAGTSFCQQNVNDQTIFNVNSSTEKDLAIAWINLSYFRDFWLKKPKVILNNLNGKINFGTLTALMGSSGAGKTTLLRCINGMNWSGFTRETKIYVNKNTPIRSCFIVQEKEDHLLMNLTVKESLMYSYYLKNSHLKFDKYNIEKIIRNILSDLLLTNCTDNLVNKCSGGEQKRLTIGLELTSESKPNLICIDEPTSGLDSTAAEQVFRMIICENFHAFLFSQ